MNTLAEHKRLQECRNTRKEEFKDFLSGPGFRAVMDKLIAFLTDESAEKVLLRFGGLMSSDSYTDGKTITVGMLDHFFSEQYGPLDWTVVFKVLLAHEVQHINSSNFDDIVEIRKWYAKYMEPKGVTPGRAANVAKAMLNILEDGRIECIIAHKYPGYRLPLQLVNGEIRRLCAPEKQAETGPAEYADFQNQVLSYTLTGRNAPNIKVYAGTRLEREFQKIKGLIDQAIVARKSKDCMELCKKLLVECADYIASLLQGQPDEGQDESSEYTSNSGTEQVPVGADPSAARPGKGAPKPGNGDPQPGESKPGEGEGKPSEDGDKPGKGGGKPGEDGDKPGEDEGKPGEGGDKPGEDEGKPGEGGDEGGKSSGQGNKPAEGDVDYDRWADDFSNSGPEDYVLMPLSPEQMAQLRRGVSDELRAADKGDEKTAPSKEEKAVKELLEMYEGESVRVYTESFPTVPNNPLPPELNLQAKRLRRAIEDIITRKKRERRNLRGGMLDTRVLPRVGMQDDRVFMRKGLPMKADIAVFLLMDNSGSMNTNGAMMETPEGPMGFSKSALSRIAASIIETALNGLAALKISLFDVSQGKIRHATLKQFDEVVKNSRLYNSINDLGIGGGNKDGYSIRVATRELMARREPKKVMVILSDGLPSDYNGREPAGIMDVRDAVREARRKGIIVVPIMFGTTSFRKKHAEDYKTMYEEFISCDPIAVIDEFSKLFLKLVKKS